MFVDDDPRVLAKIGRAMIDVAPGWKLDMATSGYEAPVATRTPTSFAECR